MSSESNATSGMVSVVMPCYNGADFISETIDSVLAQTYENWELLIIDDGSSDNSLEIVKSYAATDPRIRPISQANAGSAAARNNGIKQARGQYIALLDSDDLWLPEFLESQITFMKSKNAYCVCSSYERIDESSQKVLKPVLAKEKITVKDIKRLDYIGVMTGLYDCTKYGKVYLHPELKSLLDDYAYWVDIISLCGVAYGNPAVLAQYRLRKNSMTSNKKKLIKVHYKFYRNYFGDGRVVSAAKLMYWAVSGLIKYSK